MRETVEAIGRSRPEGTGNKPERQVPTPSRGWTDRLHPAEKITSALFLAFALSGFFAQSVGRPFGPVSLRLSALYGVLWLVWISCVAHIGPRQPRGLRFLRNVGPWLAVMLAYNLVRYLIPALHPARMDLFLRRVEINWGMGADGWVHALMGHPAWTDFFSAVYLALFAWMVGYAFHYAYISQRHQQRFMMGFVLIYVGGFMGYVLCPATGPRYAFPEEWAWLSGGLLYAACNRAVAGMGAKLDVFPSLHAALSTYLVTWQFRFHPRNLCWGVPLLICIWLSTIFLGFHYAPDLLAGALLGFGSFWASPRLTDSLRSKDLARRPPVELKAAPLYQRTGESLGALFFRGTGFLTRFFPGFGVWLFDRVLLPQIGHERWVGRAHRRNLAILRRAKSTRRILVVSDMHIGDAIYTQTALSAIRDFIPEADLDYAVHAKVAPILEGNPEASALLPVFRGGMLPTHGDIAAVRTLLETGGYDLVFNFNPFLGGCRTEGKSPPFLDVNSFAPVFARDLLRPDAPNHFLHQVHAFVRSLLQVDRKPRREPSPPETRIYLPGAALEKAGEWLFDTRWRPPQPLVLHNPDGASPYTRIPERFQLEILEGLIGSGAFVLLGQGKTDAGIGRRLRDGLSPAQRESTALIPDHWSLETFGALIDFADLFLSGDTGPLHMAAARKTSRDGRGRFANRTAVFSIFGATPARMSGYDHFRPGFVRSNQDAVSRAFVSQSPCRNITCLNKMMKTCARPRCFESLDTRRILRDAEVVFGGERRWSKGA